MPEQGISTPKAEISSKLIEVLAASGASQALNDLADSAGGLIGSAYGESSGAMASGVLSGTLSGAIAGAVLIPIPLLGAAIGGIVGGMAGIMNGLMKDYQKDDDGYKGWYNGLYEQSRVDSAQSLLTGSALAGVLGKVKTAARRGGGGKVNCNNYRRR